MDRSRLTLDRRRVDALPREVLVKPGREGSRVAIGQTREGRFLRVAYVPDTQPGSVFIVTAYELGPTALRALRRRRKKKS